MKRALAVLVLAVVLLTMGAAAAMAADPFLPPRPADATQYGTGTPLYDDPRYDIWAYTLSTNDFGVNSPTYFLLNELLVTKAWLLKMSLRAGEYALTTDFFKPLAAQTSRASGALSDYFWSAGGAPLVVGALAVAGLWALLLYVAGKTSRVWGALGGTALVLMVTVIFLTLGTNWAAGAVSVSRQGAVQVYRAVETVSTAGDQKRWGLIGLSGDAAWRTLVYQPWLSGELTEQGWKDYRSSDGLDGGTFLQMKPAARRVICGQFNLMQVYCTTWDNDYLPHRMLMAITTLLATVVFAGVLLALAGAIILAQLTVLLLIALVPVWMIIGLWWPEGGLRLLRKLTGRFLGALISQVVLAATMAVLLALAQLMAGLLPDSGWMFQAMLLAGLAGLAFRYRMIWVAPLMATPEGRSSQAGGLARWVRPRPERPRAEEPAGAAKSPAEAMPVFAAMQWAAPAPPSEAAVSLPEGLRAPEPQPAPRATFRSEMRVLREQLQIIQQPYQDEAPALAGNAQTGHTRVTEEKSAGSARERSADSPADVTKVRPPRPFS